MKSVLNILFEYSGHCITTFILLLSISVRISAQTTTITIGIPGDGVTSSYISPYNYYENSVRVQIIYTAEEIIDAGGFAGNISSLAFDIYELNDGNLIDYTIKMAYKGDGNNFFARFEDPSGYTTVKDAHLLEPGNTGWRTINFDRNFYWNGQDNIVIDICWGVNSNSSQTGKVSKYNSLWGIKATYSQNQNVCGIGYLDGVTANYKPCIMFTITAGENMTFVSATTEQITTLPITGELGARDPNSNWYPSYYGIIVLKIITTGTKDPLHVNSISMNTNGTTNNVEIFNVAVHFNYNGDPLDFDGSLSGKNFDTAKSPYSGFAEFEGNQALLEGVNYFLISYGLNENVTDGNIFDGICMEFIISEEGTFRFPDIKDPPGFRVYKKPLSGTKVICNEEVSGDYCTVTSAIDDLNIRGLDPDGVIFNIAAGEIFNEPAPMVICQSGSETGSICFQRFGEGDNPIINVTGTSGTSDAAFQLNGSDYIIFDGIDIFCVGTSDEDYIEYGIYMQAESDTNGCQYNVVKNCTIDLNKDNVNSKGIYTCIDFPSSLEGTNSFNSFFDNTVRDSYSAYYFFGSTIMHNEGNKIGTESVDRSEHSNKSENDWTSIIDDIGGNSSTIYTIYAPSELDFQLYNTSITNVSGSGVIYGFYNGEGSSSTHKLYNNKFDNFTGTGIIYVISNSFGSSMDFYNNIIRNINSSNSVTGISTHRVSIKIFNNQIHNIECSGTGMSTGISVFGGTNIYIYNNFVYDIKSANSIATTIAGIRGIALTGGTNAYVHNNTVLLDFTALSAENQSSSFYLGTSPLTELKNNIFVNNVDVSLNGTRATAFYKTSTSLTNIAGSSDNNLYYAGIPGVKNLIFYDKTNSDETLEAYKTRLSSIDQNAVTENPPFFSAENDYNLHIKADVPTQIESGGLRISSPIVITDDYDGDIRHGESGYNGTGTAPDIGADEFNGTPYDIELITIPHLQNFDDVEAPDLPSGWSIENCNGDDNHWVNASLNSNSSSNAMNYSCNTINSADDWFFSPGLQLNSETNYEVIFWYCAESESFPEKLEVKYGSLQNESGMISNAIFYDNNIINTSYKKGTAVFTPAVSGLYFIGWHCFSSANQKKLFVDDILFRVQPSASNNQVIPALSTNQINFTGTGTTIQFTVANIDPLDLTVEKINSSPGGTPPVNILNIASQYWSILVNEGIISGTYSITLDISGVPGVVNPAVLHLLRRNNINSEWIDLGVPDIVNGNSLTWSGLISFSDFSLGGDSENPLPVELLFFNASIFGSKVNINWQTATEVNNYGFEIERASYCQHETMPILKWKRIGFVEGYGNSNSIKNYSFIDESAPNGKIQYRLKQIDTDGGYFYSESAEIIIENIPTEFALYQNYPNPFNPLTTIKYSVPKTVLVKINIYDILAREIIVLVNEVKTPGNYEFDFNASQLSSGAYYYRIQAGDFLSTKKMLLVK